MLGLSCHVSTQYAELPFAERFAAAARDGFRCVELWAPDDADLVVREVTRHRLAVAVLNLPAGPGPRDVGRLADPSATEAWRRELLATVSLAVDLGCPAVNVLGGARLPIGRARQYHVMAANLAWALERLPDGIDLLLEPLNRRDRPSYVIRSIEDVVELRGMLGDPPRLRLLFDAYHLHQGTHDLTELFWRWQHLVGHVQIADVPGRGEPGSGEIDFPAFLAAVQRSTYAGWIGLEYVPSDGHGPGLRWLRDAEGLTTGMALATGEAIG